MKPRRYQCRRVEGPIKIDGSLEDPAWQELPWTDDFVDITGQEELPPSGAVGEGQNGAVSLVYCVFHTFIVFAYASGAWRR